MIIRPISIVFLIFGYLSLLAFGIQKANHSIPSDYVTPSAPIWMFPCLAYLIFGYTQEAVCKRPAGGEKLFWSISALFNAFPWLLILFHQFFVPPWSSMPWSQLQSMLMECYHELFQSICGRPEHPLSVAYLAEIVSYGLVMLWMPLAMIISSAMVFTCVHRAKEPDIA